MIRPGVEADAPQLVRMAKRFLEETAYGALLQPSDATLGELVALVDQIGQVYVAEVLGEVVGMIAVLPLPHPADGRMYADEVAWWVEPEHRTGRIGPQLLRAVEDWSRDQGLFMVKVTAPANTAVGVFYRRAGYLEVETAYVKVL